MSQQKPNKFDQSSLNQGLFFDQNYLNQMQNPYGQFENPSDPFTTPQSTILKVENPMMSQQSMFPSFSTSFDRPTANLASPQPFPMGSKTQSTQVTKDGMMMPMSSYQSTYKPTPETLFRRTQSQDDDEQIFKDVNAFVGAISNNQQPEVYLDPQQFFKTGGNKYSDIETSNQRWQQPNFGKYPEFEVRREPDLRQPTNFLSNPAQPQSHDDDEEIGYSRERVNSKNTISIEDKLSAISRSVHGATKYLNEILAKSKKNLNISFEETIVNKQPNFHCILSVDRYYAKKSGKSKQEAKNAAALELIKKMIETDPMADSYLMKILHSGKNKSMRGCLSFSFIKLDKSIHITRAMESKEDKFIPPTMQDRVLYRWLFNGLKAIFSSKNS